MHRRHAINCVLCAAALSSSIRAARLRNFHGKNRGGKLERNRLFTAFSRVYRQGRYSRVLDYWIQVTHAAIGSRRASRSEEIMCTKKTQRVLLLLYIYTKNVTSLEIFRKSTLTIHPRYKLYDHRTTTHTAMIQYTKYTTVTMM